MRKFLDFLTLPAFISNMNMRRMRISLRHSTYGNPFDPYNSDNWTRCSANGTGRLGCAPQLKAGQTWTSSHTGEEAFFFFPYLQW